MAVSHLVRRSLSLTVMLSERREPPTKRTNRYLKHIPRKLSSWRPLFLRPPRPPRSPRLQRRASHWGMPVRSIVCGRSRTRPFFFSETYLVPPLFDGLSRHFFFSCLATARRHSDWPLRYPKHPGGHLAISYGGPNSPLVRSRFSCIVVGRACGSHSGNHCLQPVP